ncbi:MAG: chemotaxis protein CheV [Oceanicoccus sp.]
MAGVLESVNQRTRLVGENRLELLLFQLSGGQLYGINVFKVKEVLRCPELTVIPHSLPMISGVAHIRGETIPIIDMSLATGQQQLGDVKNSFVIITEYNSMTQGFLVQAVDRIINMKWEDVHPPPAGTGSGHYLTAVTEADGKLVEIIDVERILSEVSPQKEQFSEDIITADVARLALSRNILIVDDSSVARNQIKRCIERIGVKTTLLNDGRQALRHLQALADDGVDVADEFLAVISDIEMPEMDGYTLTAAIRSDSRLADLYVVLHSSLSGGFNQAMVTKVGADSFLAKFLPNELAAIIVDRVASSGRSE